MNNDESPLSVAEQIEVLEAAKVALVSSFIGTSCTGLCYAINCVIYNDYSYLAEDAAYGGIYNVIPSFTFENAVLSGTVDTDADPRLFWWYPTVEKGGIANRLNFLDFLIDKIKNENHE